MIPLGKLKRLLFIALLVVFACEDKEKGQNSSDTTAPVIMITNPINDAVVGGIISIEAEATDNNEVIKVEFYGDESLVSIDIGAPYISTWTKYDTCDYDYRDSSFVIVALAYDASGNIGRDEVTITVSVLKEGITETDLDGNIISDDTDDWFINNQEEPVCENMGHSFPAEFGVYPAFPNPATDSTKICFALQTESYVSAKIISANGELIYVLYDGRLPVGWYNFEWNLTDLEGIKVQSGLYGCLFEFENMCVTGDIQVE